MTRLFELARTSYHPLLKQWYEAGIEAVSEKNWSMLKSTSALIYQPASEIQKVHEHIAKLKKQSSNTTNLQHHDEIIRWERLIDPAYRKWQAQQIEWFDDPFFWYQCFEKINNFPLEQQKPAETILHQLQETWISQGTYAYYSTLDVIHVYQTIMPVFSQWLYDAKIEFQKQQAALAVDFRKSYQEYLTWFEMALQQEKTLLRTCLQERLTIGLKKGYGTWDNVVGSMRDTLKAIGVLPQEPKLDRALAYGHLTPQAFVDIKQIIEQDGNEEEKAVLYTLPYYCQSFNQATKFWQYNCKNLQSANCHFPLSENYTPSFKTSFYQHLPRFLQWLFWDEEVRERFFQHPHCQFLRAQETAFLTAEVDLSNVILGNFLYHPAWLQNQMCLNLLCTEHQRIEKWLKHPLAFFFPATVKRLQDYQQSLKNSAQHWITKQAMILKQAMAGKETILLSENEQSSLKNAWVHIDALQNHSLFSKDILDKLAQLKLQYQALCFPKPNQANLSAALLEQNSTIIHHTDAASYASQKAFSLLNLKVNYPQIMRTSPTSSVHAVKDNINLQQS